MSPEVRVLKSIQVNLPAEGWTSQRTAQVVRSCFCSQCGRSLDVLDSSLGNECDVACSTMCRGCGLHGPTFEFYRDGRIVVFTCAMDRLAANPPDLPQPHAGSHGAGAARRGVITQTVAYTAASCRTTSAATGIPLPIFALMIGATGVLVGLLVFTLGGPAATAAVGMGGLTVYALIANRQSMASSFRQWRVARRQARDRAAAARNEAVAGLQQDAAPLQSATQAPDMETKGVSYCTKCGFPSVTTSSICHNCNYDSRPSTRRSKSSDRASGPGCFTKSLQLAGGGIWVISGFNPVVLIVVVVIAVLLSPLTSWLDRMSE